MGALCGKSLSEAEQAEHARSKALEKNLRNAHAQSQQVNRLLLLGAGESGKSTLFKQMHLVYGAGYSKEDLRGYVATIHGNVLSSLQTLVEKAAEFGVELAAPDAAQEVLHMSVSAGGRLTPESGAVLRAVWDDPGIQTTYDRRSTYQLTDSTNYFCERLPGLTDPAYLPDQQDVLRSRVRTTGIVEESFQIDGNNFQMFDVGGQRNERRKWIHCFEEVTAVLFVAAVSAYDQVLFEDESTNRMHEAINLFNEICNSRWFNKTSMILMLNKTDLFYEKIEKVPLTVCFPDYEGPDGDAEEALGFIQDTFHAQNRSPERQVYVHLTCATDTNQMRVIFSAVKDVVIRRSLVEGGLLA